MKLERDLEIVNEYGMHARAASTVVKAASRFNSKILIHRGHIAANAKSIMGLLALAAPKGTVVKLIVDGDDAEEAMAALAALFQKGFGE